MSGIWDLHSKEYVAPSALNKGGSLTREQRKDLFRGKYIFLWAEEGYLM